MSVRRQRQMSFATPQALAPYISGELREAADRLNIGVLEAAAFLCLSIPILKPLATRLRDSATITERPAT